jgi:hypothetical protein
VALAHPLASPAIEAIIQRTDNQWASKIRRTLFPKAELVSVAPDDQVIAHKCSQSGHAPPVGARFCPECGARVNSSDELKSPRNLRQT